MTNEEKATQIASVVNYDPARQIQFVNSKVYNACLQMAQWKDAQYAEVLDKISSATQETKRLTAEIRENLKQMYKINNQ